MEQRRQYQRLTHLMADPVRYAKWGGAIPIVFPDGAADKVGATRKKFPDARYVEREELSSVLSMPAREKVVATYEKRNFDKAVGSVEFHRPWL